MEKVKISGPIHRERYHYEWKLTQDEKENLREILKDFKPHCVKDFIPHFEYLCQCVLTVSEGREGTYKRPSKEDHRDNIRDAIKTLEEARAVVKKIKKGRLYSFLPYSLKEPSEYDWGASLTESQSLAFGIDRQIGELINIFKNSPDFLPKRGNATIREDFGAAIADAYMEHLGRPTTTISTNPQKGQFQNTLSFAFKVVGLPNEDVSKIARAVCPKKRGWKPRKKVA